MVEAQRVCEADRVQQPPNLRRLPVRLEDGGQHPLALVRLQVALLLLLRWVWLLLCCYSVTSLLHLSWYSGTLLLLILRRSAAVLL